MTEQPLSIAALRRQERAAKFAERYVTGEGITEICIDLGISATTAYRIIRAGKLTRPRGAAEAWRLKKFRDYYTAHGGVMKVHGQSYSIEALAAQHRLDPVTVRAGNLCHADGREDRQARARRMTFTKRIMTFTKRILIGLWAAARRMTFTKRERILIGLWAAFWIVDLLLLWLL
jgi:hypothetical protein